MEEYTQITLDQWVQWKEDVRIKLAETATNFVYIGYRLKQIRDSGMYDGAADIFGFAEKEYGLGKSTVSRFIAINERYSEGGNSLELKEEFRGFSSSKLAEMLTLPDSELQLITEKTTIREIRELKNFNNQMPEAAEGTEETIQAAGTVSATEWTPLEKCIIDFFKARKEMLNSIMNHLEAEPPEYKQAAELMAPSGQASHKKGIVFLFLYDWNTGIKYKSMTEPEPKAMSWTEFLNSVYHIFGACPQGDVWNDFYGEQENDGKESKEEPPNGTAENTVPAQSDQGKTEPVATSQQEEKTEEAGTAEQEVSEQEMPEQDEAAQEAAVIRQEEEQEDKDDPPENEDDKSEDSADAVEENMPGQMNIADFPEYMPEDSEKPETRPEPVATSQQEKPEMPQAMARKAFKAYMEALKTELDNVYRMAGLQLPNEARKNMDKAAEILSELETLPEIKMEADDGEA